MLKLSQVAAELNVSLRHVRRLIDEQQLAVLVLGKKVYRIAPEELQRFLAEGYQWRSARQKKAATLSSFDKAGKGYFSAYTKEPAKTKRGRSKRSSEPKSSTANVLEFNRK